MHAFSKPQAACCYSKLFVDVLQLAVVPVVELVPDKVRFAQLVDERVRVQVRFPLDVVRGVQQPARFREDEHVVLEFIQVLENLQVVLEHYHNRRQLVLQEGGEKH